MKLLKDGTLLGIILGIFGLVWMAQYLTNKVNSSQKEEAFQKVDRKVN